MRTTRKLDSFPFVLLLVLSFVSISLLPEIGAARVDSKMTIGAKLESFSMPDPDGKLRSFEQLKGKNGTVFVFLSTKCPFVNSSYKDRIAQLTKDYAAKGINVIGVNSNINENKNAAAIKSNAKERGFDFPILIDENSVFAEKLGATRTPQVYYFNAENVLVYKGAIDNDSEGSNITQNFLRDAIEATLAGKAVTKTETSAIGCTIKSPKSMNQ